jgi:hypothetical protein
LLKDFINILNFRFSSILRNIFESLNKLKYLVMKRLAIASLVFLFAVSLVQGQTKNTETKKEQKAERVALKNLEGNNVSAMSKNNFTVDFGNIPNVQWKRVGTYDEASFMKDGKEIKAFYDFDAKLVGTTRHVTFADVPAAGQKEIKNKYKDYKVEAVIFFDDNEANVTDMILYGVQFDDEDNYFVELSNGKKRIILQVISSGEVFYFKEL